MVWERLQGTALILIITIHFMLPFDYSMQQQCMADCYNDLYPCAPPYPAPYWPLDYSLPHPSYPAPYLYYLPAYSLPDKDDHKPAPPTTDTVNNDQMEGEGEGEEGEGEVRAGLEIDVQEGEEVSGSKSDQRFGRNIVSNIFQNIIKKSTTEPLFARHIASITAHHRMTMTPRAFQERLQEKTGSAKGYISMKSIKGMLMKKRIGATRADQEFSKILRILSRIYIDRDHLPHLYHSTKIKKKSRELHLKRMRKLRTQLF